MGADFMAGLTGAVIVLPQGVAFAMIAGLPPVYGLYTAMITPIIAALFGSSFHLISGPTTAISIVVFSAINQFGDISTEAFVSYAILLTFMAGVIQFVMGLIRLGSLVNFVSHTVVIGFTAGAAILIATKQLKHVFGIEVPRGSSFIEIIQAISMNIDKSNWYMVLVAIITLGSALIMKKISKKIPNMLIAMIIGSAASILIGGKDVGISYIEEISGKLPAFNSPDFSWKNIQVLAPNAFAIALLGLIEAVAIARAIGLQSQQQIDGNQEFIGQGLSNIVGSFFNCYAGSGSFTRSGVNYQAGAKTPIAAIFAAVILMLVVLLVAPLTAYLPIPAMGGIILLVAYNLIDFKHIKSIFGVSKRETSVLLITFLATLFLELEFAIYLGVILSLIFYLQKTSKPRIIELGIHDGPEGEELIWVKKKKQTRSIDGIKILRVDGSLFFGSVEHAQKTIIDYSEPEANHVIIIASGINILDMAGAEMLTNQAQRLNKLGKGLYIVGMKRSAFRYMLKGNYWKEIGAQNFFENEWLAIEAIQEKMNEKP